MTALEDIVAERKRQIEVEGWTAEHDDAHPVGTMARAAAAYAFYAALSYHERGDSASWHLNTDMSANARTWRNLWPWSREWWKPKAPRRDLIRAAALIVAELERLDRLKAKHAAT